MSWVRDTILIGGLIALATGLWMERPSVCLIVMGLIGIVGGFASELFNRRKGPVE